MDKYNGLIAETTRKVIQEYLGVSDYVMEISDIIFHMMIYQTSRIEWKESKNVMIEHDKPTWFKMVYLDIDGTKVANLVYNVHVKLFGYDTNETDFKTYKNLLNEKGLLYLGYSPSKNQISLKIPYPLNGELDEYGKKFIIKALNHEVKHAFQSNKRGGTNITAAYLKSLNETDWDKKEEASLKLMKYYIKNCYYVLDLDEIDARLQEIYVEMQHNGGNYKEAPSYKRIVEAIKNYNWILNTIFPKNKFDEYYYKNIRENFTNILNEELGSNIRKKTFFYHCKSGIVRFNEHLPKIITRYREENNLVSNGSFKQYARNEIPQGEIFKLKNNGSLWNKLKKFIKRR